MNYDDWKLITPDCGDSEEEINCASCNGIFFASKLIEMPLGEFVCNKCFKEIVCNNSIKKLKKL